MQSNDVVEPEVAPVAAEDNAPETAVPEPAPAPVIAPAAAAAPDAAGGWTLPPWLGIGALALALRVILLDHDPLSPSEAMYAVSAWEATRGQFSGSLVELGAPVHVYLMTLLFFVLSGSDAVARFPSLAAGVGLALSPWLFVPLVGRRAALAAGALVAVSPIAVHLAQVADPASSSGLAVVVLVGCVARLLTDRPSWAPLTTAVAVGVGLATSSATLVGLAAGGIAALSALQLTREQFRAWGGALGTGAGRAAVLTAGFVAVVASTAGFADLRGVGFLVGDLWGGLFALATPAPFPSRNFAALLVYHGPVLLLSALAAIWGVRAKDRIVMFLAQWSLLLVAVAIGLGQSVLALALLPVVPTALLAGVLLGRFSWSARDYVIGGSAGGVVALTIGLGSVAALVVAQGIGSDRGAPVVAMGVVVIAILLIAYLWWQEVPATERAPAVSLLVALLFGAATIGSLGRLCYGGSDPGAEIFPRQETAPQLRAIFDDIRIMAMADAARTLILPPNAAPEIRWYARIVPPATRDPGRLERPIVVQEGPPVEPGSRPTAENRVPWTTVSTLNRSELHPLAVLRWLVSRHGLVTGTSRDLIVTF